MQNQIFPQESSWRTGDDSLSGNDRGESPQSGGIATLNPRLNTDDALSGNDFAPRGSVGEPPDAARAPSGRPYSYAVFYWMERMLRGASLPLDKRPKLLLLLSSVSKPSEN